MLFSARVFQSLQNNTDTDPVTHLFLRRLLVFVSTYRSEESPPEKSTFNSLSGSQRRHSERQDVRTSPGPALTTWSSAAARQIIIKMNASCLLASHASFLTSVALITGSSVGCTAVVIKPASPLQHRSRCSVEHVWLPTTSRVHLRCFLTWSSSCWQGVELSLHRTVGWSLSEQFTFQLQHPVLHALHRFCCFFHCPVSHHSSFFGVSVLQVGSKLLITTLSATQRMWITGTCPTLARDPSLHRPPSHAPSENSSWQAYVTVTSCAVARRHGMTTTHQPEHVPYGGSGCAKSFISGLGW